MKVNVYRRCNLKRGHRVVDRKYRNAGISDIGLSRRPYGSGLKPESQDTPSLPSKDEVSWRTLMYEVAAYLRARSSPGTA